MSTNASHRLHRRKSIKLALIILLSISLPTLTTSCGKALWPWSELWEDNGGGGGGGGENYSPGTPAVEATETYKIALGGVAPGRDELILTDDSGNLLDLSGSTLDFEVDNDMVGLLPRPDYDDFTSGSGAQIVPQKVGFAVISYYIDDVLQEDRFLAIVPPQSLIQMMVAEGSAQLTGEAEVGSDSHVKLSSTSPTADGLGAVTRNRVEMIYDTDNPPIFTVDEEAWALDPPSSYFDSVITAESNGIYQYSPVSPDDPTHDTFIDAEARSFLDPSLHRAYDQAVLSAANIFSEDTLDPTGGAFAFYSPTEDEWEEIEHAYSNNMISIPVDCGVSDSFFPALAPIQIVILDDVWTYPSGRPAFVFIRSREARDYAVVVIE